MASLSQRVDTFRECMSLLKSILLNGAPYKHTIHNPSDLMCLPLKESHRWYPCL